MRKNANYPIYPLGSAVNFFRGAAAFKNMTFSLIFRRYHFFFGNNML